jgi:hypothetical protein
LTETELGEPEVIVLRRLDAGDVARLGEGLIKKLMTRLFVADNRLLILDGTHLVPATPHVVRALISKVFVTPSLVERGSRLAVELVALPLASLSNQVIADVTAMLVLRCAIVGHPKALPLQQASEIRARIFQGEPREAVARAYNVPIDLIPTRQQLQQVGQ